MDRRAPWGKCVLLFGVVLMTLLGCTTTVVDQNAVAINEAMAAGDAYYDAGDYQLAIDKYATVTDLDKDYLDAWINKARSEVALGQTAAARADLNTAKGIMEQTTAEYADVEGMIFWHDGKRDDAVKSFTESIAIKPTAYAYSNRGHVNYELHKLDEAKSDLTEAIKLNPDLAEPHHTLAQIAVDAGDYVNAKKYAESGLKLDAKDARNQAIIGYSTLMLIADDVTEEVRTQKEAQAWKELEAAKTLDAKEAVVYNYMGLYKAELGDYEEAKKLYDQAIGLNDKEATFYNNRGIAYYNLGKNGEALTDVNRAITLDKLNPEFFLGRGFILTTQGLEENAIADFKQAVKLDAKYIERVPGWLAAQVKSED
ncbi:tetratricopeptide repeat protein [Culicoidibacter larvae]|nr:tetratricopeptide repeat protein [Culicoidibacter larvae]